MMNGGKGHCDFKVYRKNAITNVMLKPNLEDLFTSAYDEVEFLINVFVENGHSRGSLRTILVKV